MKEFIIPFFGLKPGKHEFKFNIDRSFFEAFESNLLEDAEIGTRLELEKLSNMLILNFAADGYVHVPCDRCGEEFDMHIAAKDKVIVKFGDETFEQTDDIVVLSHDTHEIDVSQYIYEMIILFMPNKRVHPEMDDCDQEALKKLAKFRSKKNEDESDPRWDALKKLK